MAQKNDLISRKKASEILGITTRTLDRHIQSKKINSQLVNSRVWLNRGDVQNYKKGIKSTSQAINLSTSDSRQNSRQQSGQNSRQNSRQESRQNEEKKSRQNSRQETEQITRQNETQTIKQSSKTTIGQDALKYKLSLLEDRLKETNEFYSNKEKNYLKIINTSTLELKEKQKKLKYEKIAKQLLFLLLVTLLILQPIWLYLVIK